MEVARILAKLYGEEIQPEITNKFRKGDVRHCYADISRIEQLLGFQPQVTFEEGMKELVEWAEGVEAEDKFELAERIEGKNIVLIWGIPL